MQLHNLNNKNMLVYFAVLQLELSTILAGQRASIEWNRLLLALNHQQLPRIRFPSDLHQAFAF